MKTTAEFRLKKILSDNTSGSTEILLKLIKLSKYYSGDKNILLNIIDKVNKHLKTFSIVHSFTRDFRKIIKGNDKSRIINFLNNYIEKIENKYSNLFKNSLPYLENRSKLVTLSNSKTIIEILLRLNKENKIQVTIGESSPQLEGRIMAKRLLKHKIRTKIIADAFLPDAVEKADAAVIGADIILSNGEAVNKIGSRSLAIACRYFKKPFYVLATKDKFSNRKKYIPDTFNENEIWNFKHKLLTKSDSYFEVVEKKLITKIISD